jgi:hypothetical protein
MLHLASRSRTHLPLGIHGAILPFILAPAGYLLGRGLGFLKATSYGFIKFGLVEIHYARLAVVFPVVLIVYYLVWKYLIGFFNRVAGIAE